MQFARPCLDCGTLTKTGNRCPDHARIVDREKEARRKPNRAHYKGAYTKQAKIVRDNATICWICKQGPKLNDPWTADHIFPGVPNSPLLPAHRSCNSRRGNKQDSPQP